MEVSLGNARLQAIYDSLDFDEGALLLAGLLSRYGLPVMLEVPFAENGTSGTLTWLVANGLIVGKTEGTEHEATATLIRVDDSIAMSNEGKALVEEYNS